MAQSKIILAVACLATLGAVGAASAADLPRYTVPSAVDNAVDYAVPPAADRWTGMYAGAHLGAGFISAPDGKHTGFVGGLQAGYNQQFGQFVVGGELEGSFGNLKHHLPRGGVYEQTWSGVAKARAGVALDSILLFGTVGLAVARLDGEGTITSADRWQAGLAFGGGVEVALTDSISAKLEYTQTRFNNVPSTIGGAARTDNLVNHAIKTGINFRF